MSIGTQIDLFCRQSAVSGALQAALAQLVEHRIRNAGVTGSSPVSGTRTPKKSRNFNYLELTPKSSLPSGPPFVVRCDAYA